MPLEVLSVDKVIVSVLKNDAIMKSFFDDGVVKLFVDRAVEDESTKTWIVFELFGSPDTTGIGNVHIMARPSYMIKVCNRDLGYQALRPICDRIFDLLTPNHHGEVDGVWVGKFMRRQVIRDIDEIKNLRNFWIGQLFELIAY